MMSSSCLVDAARALACRDGQAAANLKLVSIFIIFFTSVIGITLPVLLSRFFHGKQAYDKALLIIKCFAAGVILSTSLVHVLPDAFGALGNCQVASRHPWKDFPFSGLITLIGVLTALMVDLAATSHVDGQGHSHGHGHSGKTGKSHDRYERIGANEELSIVCKNTKESAITLVADVKGADESGDRLEELTNAEELMKMKQRLVSQVLEIGIIFHSVIIGVTMGMSQNKCTIRPLVAALSFHQIFEGMGLGGCIAQAGFGFKTTVYMCLMFSVTTPMGIVLGMAIFSVTGYDDSSSNALILEGLLGSLSSGILIYMALVDLIALDFFHSKLMASDSRLKTVSFVALVLGSTSMSVLALWA